MAVPTTLNDVIQVRTLAQLADQSSINVLHYKLTGGSGAGVTLEEIATRFANLWATRGPDLTSSQAEIRGVGVSRLTPDPTAESFASSGPIAGGRGGDPLPGQVAGVVSKRTATPGRRGRGRAYLGFASEFDNGSDHIPIEAYQNALDRWAQDFLQPVTVTGAGGTATATPVLLHRQGLTTLVIVAWIVRAKWGTQRRRGSFGRPNVPFV